MALKFKYGSKSEVPTELASHYVEREGAWVLDADGVAERAKLEEFRANNISLANEPTPSTLLQPIFPESVGLPPYTFG